MSLNLDREAFYRRIKRLYSAWKKEGTKLNSADALICAVGQNEDDQYSKSITIQIWLFGYELTETLIGFAKDQIVLITSKKKGEFLKPLTSTKGSENSEGTPSITILTRSKESNAENFTKFYEILGKSGNNGEIIGNFAKDAFGGNFFSEYKKDFKTRQKKTVDITGDIGQVLAVKEDNEIGSMKKASLLTMEIYGKVFKENLMEIIDADRKLKHTKMTNMIEEALKDKKKLLGVDPSNVESCYPAIIQSGGTYQLKYSAQSSKEPIHFGTIIAYLGLRYKNYCSNAVRTMFVNPTDEQRDIYTSVYEAHEYALTKLVAGAKLSSVYNSVKKKLSESKHSFLADKLGKNIGFAMGIDFREASLLISPKIDEPAKKGMVFNLNLAVADIPNKSAKDSKNKVFAVSIADTVLVNDSEPASILTQGKKRAKNISIFLKDDSSGSEKEDEKQDEEILGRGMRNLATNFSKRDHETSENKRKAHQEKLHNALNEAARDRMLENKGKEVKDKRKKTNYSYKSSSLFPQEKDIRDNRLFIDKKYETLILPFFGIPTPFHISTVKNCSTSVEGDYTYLRLNFFVPGSMMGKTIDGPYPESALQGSFMKEVTFRAPGQSGAASNLNTAFRMIKEVQKKFKTREAEMKELDGIVKQEKLMLNQNRAAPKLKDLFMRPSISQKRMQGFLEAHTNGFRYTAQRGDRIDILYTNIKHAIFQPCDKEMIMVIHFHLKNGIMVGKKRHIDIQFYIEVGEITTDLGKTGNMRDRDDLYAEQQEREQRHKLKTAFKNFMDKVGHITRDIEFDTPFRELSFHGVPHRSTCLLQPTSSALCNVTEWPCFVVSLEAVEFVHFERVSFALKNFDMVVIYKDYTRKVNTITSIPMSSLDAIKDWLNSSDIRYTEGVQSLNWSKVLKTVVDDPVGFFEQGGWDFLKADDATDDEEEEDDEDPGFDADGGSDEGETDASDSEENYTDESESDSGSEAELDSSEESGKDWDELEAEALRDDKTKNFDEPEDDRRSKKSSKSSSSKRKHSDSGKSSSKKQRRR